MLKQSPKLTEYKQQIQNLTEALSSQYIVKHYSFGEDVREGISFTFSDKVSNISDLLQRVFDFHSNQNLGAVKIKNSL